MQKRLVFLIEFFFFFFSVCIQVCQAEFFGISCRETLYYCIEGVILDNFNIVNSDVWLLAFSIAAIQEKISEITQIEYKKWPIVRIL